MEKFEALLSWALRSEPLGSSRRKDIILRFQEEVKSLRVAVEAFGQTSENEAEHEAMQAEISQIREEIETAEERIPAPITL